MSKFCVYLTVYRGNKLPPFYIGSSSLTKVLAGYHGSVASKKYRAIWLSEIKKHPELFNTKCLSFHYNTRKEALEAECRLQKKLKVVRSELYINLSVAQQNGYYGMAVKGDSHPCFGKKWSKEQKQTLSLACKGKNGRCGELNGMFNKQRSIEEKSKISASRHKRSNADNLKSYSREKSIVEKQKISAHQKIKQAGAGNNKAKRWILTTPLGEVINLHGNFKAWCKEQGLPSGSSALRDGCNGELITSHGKWKNWRVLRTPQYAENLQ